MFAKNKIRVRMRRKSWRKTAGSSVKARIANAIMRRNKRKMNDEERDDIKVLIAEKEERESELLRDLRAVRGKMEELRRKLEKR